MSQHVRPSASSDSNSTGEIIVDDAAVTAAGDPSPNGNGTAAKGMSRLPFVRKIITKLIDSTTVRLSGLDVCKPVQGQGLKAHVKIKVRDVAKGPVAFSAKVKFQGTTELCWDGTPSSARDSRSKKTVTAGKVIASASLEPLKLHANGPGMNSGETTILLGSGTDADARSLGQMVRAVLRSSSSNGLTLVLKANGITVKALGFTFKGLTLEKEIRIGGLDELGGTLRLPPPSNDGLDYLDVKSHTNGTASSASPSTASTSTKQSSMRFFKKKSFRTETGSPKSPHQPHDPLDQSQSASPRIPVQNLQITGGDAQNGISVTAYVDVTLPSPHSNLPPFSIELGQLQLSLYAVVEATGELVKCGLVRSAEKDKLTSGPSRLNVQGFVKMPDRLPIDSPQRKAAANILSSFLQNEPVSIVALVEHPSPYDRGASQAAWLSYGIAGAKLNGFLAPLGDKARLLDGAQLRAEDDSSSRHSSRDTPMEARSPTKTQTSGSLSLSPPGASAERLMIRTTVHNSFCTTIAATKIRVRAVDDSDHSIELGTVQSPPNWPGLRISPGESGPIELPFQLNADSSAMVSLLRSSARKEGLDLGKSFSHLLALLNGETDLEDDDNPSDSANGHPEDFANILSQALANLKVTAFVGLEELDIGGYRLPGGIDYIQRDLSVSVPTTAASLLVPQAGAPLVYKLVESGSIEMKAMNISTIDDGGLAGNATVSLSGFGPLSAQIFIDDGLAMIWSAGPNTGHAAAILHIMQPLAIEASQSTTCHVDIRIAPLKNASGQKNFSQLIASLLMENASTWRLETPHIRIMAGGVEFTSSLAKKIILNGFGGFKNLVTDTFDIVQEEVVSSVGHSGQNSLSASDEANALRFRTSLTLPNSSDIGISIARLDFDLFTEDTLIGSISIHEINLKAGQGVKVQGEGVLHRIKDVNRMGGIASALMNGKDIKLDISGRGGYVYTGSSNRRPQAKRSRSSPQPASPTGSPDLVRMAWLDAAVQQLHTTATVANPSTKDIIKRLELESLTASFPKLGQPKIAIGALFVKYEVPYPIDVAVKSVSANVEVLLDDTVVGRGATSDCTVVSANEQAGTRRRRSSSQTSEVEHAKGNLRLSLSDFALETSGPAFGKLIQHVFDSEETDRLSVRGDARVTVRTALGSIPCMISLGAAHRLSITGMRALRTSPTDYTDLQVVDGNREHLVVSFNLFLNNPSKNVTFNLPDSGLNFAAFYRGAFVGRAYVGGDQGPFELKSGPVGFPNVTFKYYPNESEEKEVRQLPANFLSGETTRLEIRGDADSTSIDALRPALSALRLTFDLKPILDRTLISSIEIALGAKMLTNNSVECEFGIANPLAVPIDLTSLSFVANYKGKPFGSASLKWPEGEPLRVQPGTPTQPGQATGQCLVRLSQRLDKLVKAFLSERGQLYLQVSLSAGVEMGGYRIPVFEYTQERLPLNIKNLSAVSKLLWALPG